jgi:hypothetical protein
MRKHEFVFAYREIVLILLECHSTLPSPSKQEAAHTLRMFLHAGCIRVQEGACGRLWRTYSCDIWP